MYKFIPLPKTNLSANFYSFSFKLTETSFQQSINSSKNVQKDESGSVIQLPCLQQLEHGKCTFNFGKWQTRLCFIIYF